MQQNATERRVLLCSSQSLESYTWRLLKDEDYFSKRVQATHQVWIRYSHLRVGSVLKLTMLKENNSGKKPKFISTNKFAKGKDILETNDLVEDEVLITAALSYTYMFSCSYISPISERTVRWISKTSFKRGLSVTSVFVNVLLLVTLFLFFLNQCSLYFSYFCRTCIIKSVSEEAITCLDNC